MLRSLSCMSAIFLALAARPASADGPGPVGPDRSTEERIASRDWPAPLHLTGPRPVRRIMGGPGYAGTSYGLGKPAYSGIGPRPDWGRSSVD